MGSRAAEEAAATVQCAATQELEESVRLRSGEVALQVPGRRFCCCAMERERLLYSETLLGRDGEEEVEVEVGQEAALVAHDQRPAWGLQLISSLIAQRPLASILTILHASLAALLPSQNVPDEQVAGLLRELVVQQHRTMFYTVTVAGCPSPPPDQSQHTSALQWQLASSL